MTIVPSPGLASTLVVRSVSWLAKRTGPTFLPCHISILWAATSTFAASGWTHGWTVGGGLEAAVAKNVTLGIAYDYISLDAKTFSGLARRPSQSQPSGLIRTRSTV